MTRWLGSGLFVATVLVVLAHPRLAAAADTAAMAPQVEVSVDCFSVPERVTITNDRARPIRIVRVGSTYQRRSGEPFRVRRVLRAGGSVTFTFGTGKGGKRLSRSFIFDNESPREGVRVRTNRGRVTVSCTEGSNARSRSLAEEAGSAGPAAVSLDEPASPLETLASLAVAAEVGDGYDRTLFRHWIDADGDGCDTREEVLAAESLTPVTIGDGCSLAGGTWYSVPDGVTLADPASVDIDHLVPLREAWASGAFEWSAARREAFANDLSDPRTLQAVSSSSNRQRGARDPASWLPADREVACQFVADWVAVKWNWGLGVDAAEREAIELTLQACAEAATSADARPGTSR